MSEIEYSVFIVGATQYNMETGKLDPAEPYRANCNGETAPITTDRAVAQRWADSYRRAFISSVELVVMGRLVTEWSSFVQSDLDEIRTVYESHKTEHLMRRRARMARLVFNASVEGGVMRAQRIGLIDAILKERADG